MGDTGTLHTATAVPAVHVLERKHLSMIHLPWGASPCDCRGLGSAGAKHRAPAPSAGSKCAYVCSEESWQG